MKKLSTVLGATACLLTALISTNAAWALDPSATAATAKQTYIQYERTLTTPPEMSLEQRHLLAASLTALHSTVQDKMGLIYDLMHSGIEVVYLKRSDTSFVWNTIAWIPNGRTTYTYGSNHKLSEQVGEEYLDFDTTWTNSDRTVNTYDGSSRLATSTSYHWETDHWQADGRGTYSYDGSGNVSQILTEKSSDGVVWVNDSRATLTYVGGRLTEMVLEKWSVSAFVNFERFVLTYDGSNRLSQTWNQHWNGAWYSLGRSTNTYDGSGNLAQMLDEDSLASGWRNSFRYNYTYDGSHNQILGLNWDWDTASTTWTFLDADTSKYAGGHLIEDVTYYPGIFAGLLRSQYSYDGNGNLIETISASNFLGTWTDTYREVDIYTVLAVGTLGGDGDPVPKGFTVSQNYPNPFNLSTVIDYSLNRAGPVHVVVANILGQTVSTLVDAYQEEGPHSAIWNGTDTNGRVVSSGVYFYRIQAGGTQQVRKMVLLK
jgi:hypothetical protein